MPKNSNSPVYETPTDALLHNVYKSDRARSEQTYVKLNVGVSEAIKTLKLNIAKMTVLNEGVTFTQLDEIECFTRCAAATYLSKAQQQKYVQFCGALYNRACQVERKPNSGVNRTRVQQILRETKALLLLLEL